MLASCVLLRSTAILSAPWTKGIIEKKYAADAQQLSWGSASLVHDSSTSFFQEIHDKNNKSKKIPQIQKRQRTSRLRQCVTEEKSNVQFQSSRVTTHPAPAETSSPDSNSPYRRDLQEYLRGLRRYRVSVAEQGSVWNRRDEMEARRHTEVLERNFLRRRGRLFGKFLFPVFVAMYFIFDDNLMHWEAEETRAVIRRARDKAKVPTIDVTTYTPVETAKSNRRQ